MSAAAIWHDVECGAYDADLRALGGAGRRRRTGRSSTSAAAPAGSPCTSPGAATRVVGLDRRPGAGRGAAPSARERAAGARPSLGDARDFELDAEFALALAPMQLMQLLAGRRASGSPACAASPRTCCPAGAVAARDRRASCREPTSDGPPPLPDVREVDGWVYSSLPLEAAVDVGERSSSAACARRSPPTAS